MSLNLTKTQVLDRLGDQRFTIPKQILINRIKQTRKRSIDFQEVLINNKVDGWYRDQSNQHQTNPMLWEFGHIVFFWEHKTLRLIETDQKLIDDLSLPNSSDIYDSFVVSAEDRYIIHLYPIEQVLEIYNKTIDHILNMIESDNYKLTPTNCYLIYISLLHNEMHNESYLFTHKMLNLCRGSHSLKPSILPDLIFEESEINNKLLYIQGGSFVQGTNDKSQFHFDNEMPAFDVTVNDFYVSKYPVTEWEFLKFVVDGGYLKEKYWCKPGWRWKTKFKIDKPNYWVKDGEVYRIKNWSKNYGDNRRQIRKDMPICHISWYEASAYCRWAGCRLPTESEWEYLAINYNVEGNLDYKNGGIVPINYYENKDSENKVSQLFGNVWEWCLEPIYPYDGFIIDPVYREMSYPFFGFKKICRGGSWTTPNYLVNAKYRNAQMPNNQIQFIGFRIVKDNF